jgi:PEP-CTERM motif
MANNRRRSSLAIAATLAMIGALSPSRAFAGPLDPMQFTSLGALALTTPGTYTINTSGANPSLVVGGTTYYGVVSGGIAVFDFSSITTASNTLLTATSGGLPVALLSQSNATINGQINVSASIYQSGTGASNTGSGGYSTLMASGEVAYASGAGGGGFGGQGGNGGNFNNLQGGVGGTATANLASMLQGGSSGGGPGVNGGGGGAIEIGATQHLTITGAVDAIGGDAYGGGGGSGGGIFLHAASVAISGTLDAQGGSGGIGNPFGQGQYAGSGGGGGGAILVEVGAYNAFSFSGTILVQGGQGGSYGGFGGSNGQFSAGLLGETVPEPSSIILLGTSTLGLLALTVARRWRARKFSTR